MFFKGVGEKPPTRDLFLLFKSFETWTILGMIFPEKKQLYRLYTSLHPKKKWFEDFLPWNPEMNGKKRGHGLQGGWFLI